MITIQFEIDDQELFERAFGNDDNVFAAFRAQQEDLKDETAKLTFAASQLESFVTQKMADVKRQEANAAISKELAGSVRVTVK